MGRGIEHREPDTLLQAYEDYDRPNFAILSGTALVLKYDEGDADEARQMLQSIVNQIMQSDTRGVYTLRVYGENVKNITNKTAYEGSTTFMLSKTATTTTNEKGVMVIDREKTYGGKTDQAAIQRVKDLEEENKQLLERVHKTELQRLEERMRQEMDNRIAGIASSQKDGWEKFESFFEKFGDKLVGYAKDIYGELKPKNNYIVNNPASGGGAVNGTTNTETETEMTAETKLTQEGALINPFLKTEELGFKNSAKAALTKQRIDAITDSDMLDDTQSDCLQIIENRIGNATLTRMLVAVACMDNDDLNKLLSHLD